MRVTLHQAVRAEHQLFMLMNHFIIESGQGVKYSTSQNMFVGSGKPNAEFKSFNWVDGVLASATNHAIGVYTNFCNPKYSDSQA